MSLSEDLVYLILQFLHEENFKDTAHMLEIETGCFFDMQHFEKLLQNGKWDKAEYYLSGFTERDDNRFSTKIYFEIRKQKYIEALDRKDSVKAIEILNNDLKVFRPGHEELFKDLSLLLALDNIRQHEQLRAYGDINTARIILANEIKKLIAANPLIQDSLKLPNIANKRLHSLINQSLNWQQFQCGYQNQSPNIKTLFEDHKCQPSSYQNHQSSENCLSLFSYQSTPCEHMSAPFSAGTPSPFAVTCAPVSRPYTDANLEGHEEIGKVDEASECHILHDYPKTIARTLSEESSPMSMDFHPFQHTVLLVGTSIGDIGLWDVIYGNKLVSRNFKVWDIGACSRIFKVALIKDSAVSVNRIRWSPDGSLFGVAYSKHIVQLYSYHGGTEVQPKLEIDAHVGGVNDLAFATPFESLFIITCGDDKTVKVWDVDSGTLKYTLEGHEGPVYSICPHIQQSIHLFFSTSVDGRIKGWLYDTLGARINYESPGQCCTRMAYSTTDMRLFSCGTTKDGESFLVEWDESDGFVKRTYKGLSSDSSSIVQFDTNNSYLLAAGDNHTIKFWDMDNVQLLTTIDVDGCLPANPHLRFNKDGTLLAVVANENRIKILATNVGLKFLQISECPCADIPGIVSETMTKKSEDSIKAELKSKSTKSSNGTPNKICRIHTYNETSKCRSMELICPVTNKISRLVYTNECDAVLALTSNGLHLVWKWPTDVLNSKNMVAPQLWHPQGYYLPMTNDLLITNFDEAVPCFALSKNDSYLISGSGGKLCLYNMFTFKKMVSFMPALAMTTCIAFHPKDNNVIAIGLDDSTIVIYNLRAYLIICTLKGHSKQITSLAFSSVLNVLISSDADAQIIMWSSDDWEKQNSVSLEISVGRLPEEMVNVHIQFNRHQTHFLAVLDTGLTIYETTKLECVNKWVNVNVPLCAVISHATFSCDYQLVYASFKDGNVCIFTASDLRLQSRITPTAYLPVEIDSSIYPVVIAAHPKKPFQIALGLSDGSAYILEPLELNGKWTLSG